MRMRVRFAVLLTALLLTGSALPAVGSGPIAAEYLVSPGASHFPQNKQNESPMAVNPVNPLVAVSGANDEIEEPDCTLSGGSSSCPFDPNVGVTGVYITRDGGATWSQQILHWNAWGLISDGDPVVTFGPKPDGRGGFTYAHGARLYFASLAGSPAFGPNQEQLAVAYSDDDGLTWSAPVVATNRTNPVDFNDKLAVWADQNPSSPYFGNLYLSWTLFRSNGKQSPEPIMFTRSTDGALTFAGASQLTPAYNNSKVGGRQGSVIRTGPDGTVYVIWDGSWNKQSAIVGTRSGDGGNKFGQTFHVADKSDIPSPFPGASFRNDSFPLVDVDGRGRLYVVWADYDYALGHGTVKLARSADRGATWTTSGAAGVPGRSAFNPAIAVSGRDVFIGFNAIDDKPAATAPGAGVVTYDAYFVLSGDEGATFGTPVKLSAAPSDPDAGSTNSLSDQFLGDYNGAAASPDGTFWFSWTDTRAGNPCAAVDAWRASNSTLAKPDIYAACPAGFGNTDIRVGKIQP
ncbi:MAG TPA: sialidase family protein [Symbiobacteriaceae bacterium]|jgi:hypothetical protein